MKYEIRIALEVENDERVTDVAAVIQQAILGTLSEEEKTPAKIGIIKFEDKVEDEESV